MVDKNKRIQCPPSSFHSHVNLDKTTVDHHTGYFKGLTARFGEFYTTSLVNIKKSMEG